MQQNLWMYANQLTRNEMAGSLIAFGAETFKNAKIIKELDLLKDLNRQLRNQNAYDPKLIRSFAFEYLIDCVRILIFFENYMKAELIARGYVVHSIDNNSETYRPLLRKQQKEPVSVEEIHNIQPFTVDQIEKRMTHDVEAV